MRMCLQRKASKANSASAYDTARCDNERLEAVVLGVSHNVSNVSHEWLIAQMCRNSKGFLTLSVVDRIVFA